MPAVEFSITGSHFICPAAVRMQMCDKEVFAFKQKNQCRNCSQTVPWQFVQKQTLNGRRTAPWIDTKDIKYSWKHTQRAAEMQKQQFRQWFRQRLLLAKRQPRKHVCFLYIFFKKIFFFLHFCSWDRDITPELQVFYNRKEEFQEQFFVCWSVQKEHFTVFSVL